MTEEPNSEENKEPKKPEPSEEIVKTQHQLTIDGRTIEYTATAGTIILKEEDEEGRADPKATIFYTAYTLNGVENFRQRPVTFAFNGGPGSSSVWLHLGLLGPRRVDLGQEGHLTPPPYRLLDNDFSLLDVSDLVFIDPVTTGYSRTVVGEEAKQFHDFKKDIESVGEFIRLYTTRNQRWLSPKFLIGESYGTTRAAGLSGFLQEQLGMYLNGIMLISSVLNFQTLRFSPGNDLPYIFFLPSFAATAWYHQQLAPDDQRSLPEMLEAVETFAAGDYAQALMQGSALVDGSKEEIANRLASYLGLDPAYIKRTNLRVEIGRFVKELLRDQRRTVGRLDSRFLGIDRDAAGEYYEFDPSMATIQGPYTAAFYDYVRRELGFETDLPYEILTGRVHPWRFEQHQNEYVNVAETLRKALNVNPHLKVFVGSGYYDLATPYMATRYTFTHMDIEPELQDNISLHYYEAGHMMYIHIPSLQQLKADLARFITHAVPTG